MLLVLDTNTVEFSSPRTTVLFNTGDELALVEFTNDVTEEEATEEEAFTNDATDEEATEEEAFTNDVTEEEAFTNDVAEEEAFTNDVTEEEATTVVFWRNILLETTLVLVELTV